MKKKFPSKKFTERKLDHILLAGVLLVFLGSFVVSYVDGDDMESLVSILNSVGFSYLFALFGYWFARALAHPGVHRVSEKDDKIIKNMIRQCLEEASIGEGESMSTLDLLYCVETSLEQEGIFYITLPQINTCIEQVASSGEYELTDMSKKLQIEHRKRKIWRFLAYYGAACFPGGFYVMIIGSTGLFHLKYCALIGYFMVCSGVISVFISMELRLSAKSQF